jgi:hypothetical protein
MKLEGNCHCGEITFEADIDPEAVRICHCTDCQTLTGSAYRVTAQTSVDGFHLRSGTLKTYVKTAESGTTRAHAFCPNCGTPIYSTDLHEPRAYGVRVGTLKRRRELRPSRQIWCQSALPWINELNVIPQIDRQ